MADVGNGRMTTLVCALATALVASVVGARRRARAQWPSGPKSR